MASAPAAYAAPAPERVYELASSPDKNAGVAFGSQSTSDGDAVAFYTVGTAGNQSGSLLVNPYVARRGAEGWKTTRMAVDPLAVDTGLAGASTNMDFTPDLRTAYSQLNAAAVPGDANEFSDVYSIDDTGALSWLTPRVPGPETSAFHYATYVGRSDDGSHVIVSSNKPLVDGAPADVEELYDITPTGTKLVSVLPDGTPSPTRVTLAGAPGFETEIYGPANRTAVSADGRRVVFGTDGQLYVRLDGTSTLLVSASAKAADPANTPAPDGATFQSASADTGVIVFTSASKLLDDPAADTGGVYAYDVDARSLRLLAGLPAAPAIADVVQMTPDGERVYLVTDAQLGGEGATDGSANLYLLEDGDVTFIASLDGFGGDAAAWQGGDNRSFASSVSADGRWLAFTSVRNLTSYDAGGVAQVYRYDAEADGLTCASCPDDGEPATGAAALEWLSLGTEGPFGRNFTDDGRLYFQTPQPLVAADDDDLLDVYQLDPDGDVHLITPGTDRPVNYVDNSADGRDVFVRTAEALTPSDVDGGLHDVYDARVGGVAIAPPAAPCEGAACRGPIGAPPASPPAPPSEGAQGDGDGPSRTHRVTFRRLALSAAARKRWARTGRVTVRVKVSDGAVVRVKARSAIGRKLRTVASTARSRTTAGTVSVPLRLSKAARAALRRNGRLTVRVTVTCSDAARSASTTLVLRRAGRST